MLTIQILDKVSVLPYLLMLAPGLRHPLLGGEDDAAQIVLGATFWGQPAGVAIAYRGADSARLLDIYVLPSYRQAGIGRALLAAVEEACRLAGKSRVQALYCPNEQTPAFEALLVKEGWAAPLVRSRVYWTSCSAGYDGWAQRYRFRAPYEPVLWAEISEAERQVIARRGEGGWYPPHLDPLTRPTGDWDPKTSLGLRYKGEVVGWLLTLREAPDQIRVEIMFVDPPLQRLGRGILLICEMIRRYCNDGEYAGGCNEHCYWRVDAANEGMIRWSQRSFPGRFTDEYEEWYTEKILDP